jgi:geranylgeranyl pyrophosphate synthase/uncharacterized protein with NAD-binding domain and iron-sulfur cluster
MTSRVIVLGGGVAGMSAAQELIERGFEVVVLERRSIAGGKARSIPVDVDAPQSSGHEVFDAGVEMLQHQLPGEHGFRFFPGFYKHIIDTMRRVPSFDGAMVADHLVPTTRVGITQYENADFTMPAVFPASPGDVGVLLRDLLLAFSPVTGITQEDLAFFGGRIWQFLTSCAERRLGEYESVPWWDFVAAEERSAGYQKFLAAGITRSLVAAKARTASTRTIGDVFVQLILTIINPVGGATDRVLDGPTNLVWIDPWRDHLVARGVHYITEAEVTAIHCRHGLITGVSILQGGHQQLVSGDHYIAALPIERIAPLIDQNMLAADPSLANLAGLAPNVEWMNGVQYYLRRELPFTHGHVIHIDTPWALTSISQLQFWRSIKAEQFGHKEIRGLLSVDISDWTLPGGDGRPAMQCSREEVIRETWEQLKLSLNGDQEILRDDDLYAWFLDPDIDVDLDRPGYLSNSEPLLVNLVNTWALRPEATTGIANLFLASDYVRTHTDLATMEGANEAARRAVNGLLAATGSTAPSCDIWPLHEPEILLPLRLYDAARYRNGQPWDGSLLQVAQQAIGASEPLLANVAPLIAQVEPWLSPALEALEQSNAQLGALFGGQPFAGLDPAVTPGSQFVASPSYALSEAAAQIPGGAALLGPAGFVERLAWYREQLSDTLAAGVPSWEPQNHLYGLVSDYLSRSGKGLRPALCLATTRALGGSGADAYSAAAGLEMLHNAFLVHDDIEDGSDQRRGVATMHRRAGLPLAVNAGDAMNALAMRLFRGSGQRLAPATVLRILDEVDHLLVESLEGQAMELGWTRDNHLAFQPDDYMLLVLKKAAWYSFIHPLRIGALVADGKDEDLGRFDQFGFLLGLAFQITDDVLNLNGESTSYGKEIDGDLWEGKRTLILSHGLSQVTAADRQWMEGFLAKPRERRLPRDVMRMHNLLELSGSMNWADQVAKAFTEAAIVEFETRAFAGVAAGPDLAWLRSCIDYLVQRQV